MSDPERTLALGTMTAEIQPIADPRWVSRMAGSSKAGRGAAAMQRVVIGMAELWCGDCREVLPHLCPDVAIVSDPPYGIAYRHGG